MAGFGMILGGAVKGYGEGILAEAKAKRQAALDALEAERQDRRLAEDRDFRSKEAAIGRDAQSAENEKQRQFQAGESEKNRMDKIDYVTDESGGTVGIRGGKSFKVTDEEGKQLKTLGTAKDKPSDVATAEWLMQQGIAADPKEAWSMVRQSRANPDSTRAAMYKKFLDLLKPEFASSVDGNKIAAEAERLTNEYFDKIEGDAPSKTPAKVSRPQGMDDAAIVKQAQDAIAAGADKAAVRARLMEMGIDPAAAGL